MSRNATAVRTLILCGAAVSIGALAGSIQPAAAQNTGCADIQPKLVERKAIVDRLQALGKKKMDPRIACTTFGQLTANGTTLVKWLDANKDWCQVPQPFFDGVKADHVRAGEMRTKACAVAAQMTQMEKKAKEQAAGQGGGLLGGNGLEGQYRMPQGAL